MAFSLHNQMIAVARASTQFVKLQYNAYAHVSTCHLMTTGARARKPQTPKHLKVFP